MKHPVISNSAFTTFQAIHKGPSFAQGKIQTAMLVNGFVPGKDERVMVETAAVLYHLSFTLLVPPRPPKKTWDLARVGETLLVKPHKRSWVWVKTRAFLQDEDPCTFMKSPLHLLPIRNFLQGRSPELRCLCSSLALSHKFFGLPLNGHCNLGK